jgi:hypothetical protein
MKIVGRLKTTHRPAACKPAASAVATATNAGQWLAGSHQHIAQQPASKQQQIQHRHKVMQQSTRYDSGTRTNDTHHHRCVIILHAMLSSIRRTVDDYATTAVLKANNQLAFQIAAFSKA